MRRLFLILATLIAATASSPAFACNAGTPTVKNGRIPFEYVICSLAGQSIDFMKDIRKKLIDEGKDIDEVTCTSVTLGDKFKNVGDIHVTPFSCKIGAKYLTVNADVMYFDDKGRAGPRPRSAKYLMLARPRWSWR